MSQPTEREREKAADLLANVVVRRDSDGLLYNFVLREDIAVALAQAREEGAKSAPCNFTECRLKRHDKGETK